MQYFISAENTSYFYWQLEILIESFLMQGLEKDLVIGIAENDSQKLKGYSSNLVKYCNKFEHSNEGRSLDYLPINRVSALRYALAYGILKFPFVLIHADMILRKPIELEESDNNFGTAGIILNNYEEINDSEKILIKKTIRPELEKEAEDRNLNVESFPEIPSFSAPMIFNKSFEYIWDPFFTKLQINMLSLLKKNGSNFPCERAAWEQTLMESFQHCTLRGRFMSGPLMLEDDNFNFIHYKSGIPPVFNKKFFKFESGTYYGEQGPYETILEHNPTVNTNFLHQVIRSYNRRKNH
jgi:hypothetical protein